MAFDSLGSYETYRARLKADQGKPRENFLMANSRRIILQEVQKQSKERSVYPGARQESDGSCGPAF
jgi:hypothetical protein